ncbi:MAG: PAS domain S-box protein [Chloroflexi bacterium]|nr:PAS domain S-box protein [Chloroflexota bacterium]
MTDSYRILVLDDDMSLGALLRSYLETALTCQVDLADSVEGFWPLIEGQNYNILFLDYRLPGITGLEVLAELKQRCIRIPTIMMTGEGSERIAVQALQNGAVDYLVKGKDFLTDLPALIQKNVRLNELQLSVERSMQQIRYQALLLDNMRDAVVVWDLEGKITFWNLAAQSLFGASAEDVLGQNVEQVYLALFKPAANLAELDVPGGYEAERRLASPQGGELWVSSRTTALHSENDGEGIIGYIDVSRDITRNKQERQALEESQHFIQRILNTTPNMMYIYDLEDQESIFINNKIVSSLGYTVAQIREMGLGIFEKLVHPEDQPRVSRHYMAFVQEQIDPISEVEYRILTASGSWRWIHTRDTVFMRAADGAPKQILGIAEDITPRRLAEDALHRRMESEQLINNISTLLINTQPDDVDAGILTGLHSVCSSAGGDQGFIFLVEPNSQAIRTAFRAPDKPPQPSLDTGALLRARDVPEVMEKLAGGQVLQITQSDQADGIRTFKKRFLPASALSTILIPMQYNGLLFGILCFVTFKQRKAWQPEDIRMLRTIGDIFANALVHQQEAQTIRENEARYRAIVDDHQTELICRFLSDTTLTFVNEAYCRYFKRSRDELVGKQFVEWVPVEDKELIYETISSLSYEQPVRTIEYRVLIAEDQVRWQEWTCRVVYDDNRRFLEFQSVGHDVTERKIMEAKVKAAQTQLAQHARLAAIGELASGVAHQINNPLTTVIADAQLLVQSLRKNTPAYESAEAIVKAGWRAQQVVQELLEYSKPDSEAQETLSVNHTIEQAVVLVGAQITATGAQLEVDLAQNLPPVKSSPRQLEDLWVNLLLVARSAVAGGDNRHVRISSRTKNKYWVVVEVSDDGPVIPAEELDKLFEPDLTSPNGQRDNGMELSICNEIVRQNDGTISVTSNDSGTVFQVILPAEV